MSKKHKETKEERRIRIAVTENGRRFITKAVPKKRKPAPEIDDDIP